jgi:hypothetical protein
MKRKLKNQDFSRSVGKSSLIRIDWKSWTEEVPQSGQDIWVVVKLEKGYYPVTGYYVDHTIPPTKGFPKGSRWISVRFHEFGIPEIFKGSRDWKRLIAWGIHKGVVRLGKDCNKCGHLYCSCKR